VATVVTVLHESDKKNITECCTVSKYQEAETQLMHTIRHVNDINQLTWNV